MYLLHYPIDMADTVATTSLSKWQHFTLSAKFRYYSANRTCNHLSDTVGHPAVESKKLVPAGLREGQDLRAITCNRHEDCPATFKEIMAQNSVRGGGEAGLERVRSEEKSRIKLRYAH